MTCAFLNLVSPSSSVNVCAAIHSDYAFSQILAPWLDRYCLKDAHYSIYTLVNYLIWTERKLKPASDFALAVLSFLIRNDFASSGCWSSHWGPFTFICDFVFQVYTCIMTLYSCLCICMQKCNVVVYLYMEIGISTLIIFFRYASLLCMLHHCLSPITQPNVIWMLGAHAFYKTITIFSSSLHAEHIVAW